MSECYEIAEVMLQDFLRNNPGVKLYKTVQGFVDLRMADESFTVRDNVAYHLHRLVVQAVDSNPDYDERTTYAN